MLGRISAVFLIGLTEAAFAANSASDIPDFPSAPEAPAVLAAPGLGYDLNTSIQTLAANSATARIVEANIPGLLEDSNYPMFKGMSLKTVASLSDGRISPDTLQAIDGQLKSVPVSAVSN